MAYLNKPLADRFNQERAKFFNGARRTHCPFCKLAGKGTYQMQLSADGKVLYCPECRDGRPATDDDRRVYGDSA